MSGRRIPGFMFVRGLRMDFWGKLGELLCPAFFARRAAVTALGSISKSPCRAAERSHEESETVSVWAALRLSCREAPMKTPGCSETSELSSLRPSQDVARLWRLASVLAVICGLLACSREAAPPAAREPRPQSAVAAKLEVPPQLSSVHSGAAGAGHGSW